MASARVIVVTGASAGLGEALARAYAEPGATLGLLGRDRARLHACADRCREAGAHVVEGVLDVCDADAMNAWLADFDHRYPVDLLIANAGVANTLSSPDDWEDLACTRRVVETNFFGAMHAVQAVAERMRARRRGQIALVASLAAIRGMAVSPAYCASKSALHAYGESVRPLLARHGIALSIVLPGFVKTAMSDVFPGSKPFLWTSSKAARVIQRGLAARRKIIAFPGPLYLGMRFVRAMPAAIGDALLALFYPVRPARPPR
ncbi:SDR family NAD(P)-dependent oxidoreductase [Caballeronia sp. LZ035]|uniref:SDR family NAD(P)-dependent oxidoreductase n=1 Tax=Caballeronia sp. LZ035 TaxID=3038568 RepID=UPI0028636830|nr:SDR family NAD(P)-dependent oxidoreductase [Caballeronia sp. LZ035]MDR5757601.1 SDR family NAD(P)-dependent oxidoreductase [Caballeronia sp. LZ035]